MTKREALRECRKMWLWLAQNPGKCKDDYLYAHKIPLYEWNNNCPCCQYVESKQPGITGDMRRYGCLGLCPLKRLWNYPAKNSDYYSDYWSESGCEHEKSPYAKWRASDFKDTASAMKIADACKETRKR